MAGGGTQNFQLVPGGRSVSATGVAAPIASTEKNITPTRLTIGDVALDCLNFCWALQPGTAPFSLIFNAYPTVTARLYALGVGPHTLVANCPSGTRDLQTLIVKQVYLRDDRPSDEAETAWRISDRRMWLDYSKYTGRHNLRRKVNDREGLDPQSLFGFNREGYKPYSAFTSIDKDGKKQLVPWTALGLIRAILETCDPLGIDANTFAGVVDNGVPPESLNFLEDRPITITPDLLRLAEVSMFVNIDGYYEFFARNVESEKTRAWTAEGWIRGRFSIQRNHRTRPSEVHCRFLEEREELCEFDEQVMRAAQDVFTAERSRSEYEKIAANAGLKIVDLGGIGDAGKHDPSGAANVPAQGGQGVPNGGQAGAGVANGAQRQQPPVLGAQPIPPNAGNAFVQAAAAAAAVNKQVPARGSPIQLENVLRVPRDVTVTVPGLGTVEFTTGEWVRFDLILAAWEILDRQAGAKPLKYLTFDTIQKYWFGGLFERLYAFDRTFPTWVNPERVERVNAVREHYRRTFRIAKPWLDNIHQWSPSRVTIVDPVTRTKALPFVSTQYCNVPNLRPPIGAQKQARVSAENVDDLANAQIDPVTKTANYKGSPFVFSQVEADVGVLQVEPMRDKTDIIRERIRGKVNDIPTYDLNPDGSILWMRASLDTNFKMKLVITVQWGAPNNKDVLYLKKLDVKNQGGQGGVLEILSTVDSARINYNGLVVNAGLLDKIAQYETRQIMFTHRDVGIGWKQFAGLREDLKPEGFCRAVIYNIEDGVAYTLYDLTEPYTQRPSAAAMDLKTREFALRITSVI